MTRPPFGPRGVPDLPEEADPVVRELEAYTSLTSGEYPHGLADRVMAAVAEEATPRRGFLAGLLGSLEAGRDGGMARMAMVAGTMALAVLAVALAGQLGNLLRDQQIGPSPLPSIELSPSLTPSPSPSPSESPGSRPSRTPRPSPTDDDSPEASESPDDDETETPEPTDDDNSGPGGGGGDDDDNSGPGGGGGSGSGSGDNSGPGGGGSGSGSGDDSG